MRVLASLLILLIGLGATCLRRGRCRRGPKRDPFARAGFQPRRSAAAYSHAAPAIQGIFPDAESFMAMVRNSYAPVYRHKSFEFGEARASDGKIAQRVHILDADGVPWEALYTLEQQPDGSLKITGCVLLKAGQAA
jgi:hypothetical protein